MICFCASGNAAGVFGERAAGRDFNWLECETFESDEFSFSTIEFRKGGLVGNYYPGFVKF